MIGSDDTKEVETICRIRIGADEIILWLRKNDKAEGVGNPTLGGRINELICEELNGKIDEGNEHYPSYWPGGAGDRNIGKYKLPLNSAQYEIEIDKMSKLYSKPSLHSGKGTWRHPTYVEECR